MTGCTFNLYRDTESGIGAIFSPLEEGVGEMAFTDDSAENGETYYYDVLLCGHLRQRKRGGELLF
jgi:hypothetical protein